MPSDIQRVDLQAFATDIKTDFRRELGFIRELLEKDVANHERRLCDLEEARPRAPLSKKQKAGLVAAACSLVAGTVDWIRHVVEAWK